jgi:regulator of protease activity HflC (stomatin/prohibitin superfamily)
VIIGVIVGLVVLFGLITLGLSIKIVREYQRIVLFRLGRAIGLRGPGLVFINPVTDRTSWVDLREQFLEIPHQTAITQDNASISIDFIIFYKVVDPAMSVLQVQNFAAAAQNVAATTLRSVVGDMPLDDVLSKREEMNASLRVRLDEVTERWGVKVTTVEVREVNPPAGVLEAMTRQMSAERTRRAAITEAQGQKQAAITLAEGTKQAAILGAEGDRQSNILRAEGLAAGLGKIFEVGRGLDRNTMQLQYLETLKQVGMASSTKIVVPMDLLGGVMSVLGGTNAQPAPPPPAPDRARPALSDGDQGTEADPTAKSGRPTREDKSRSQ